MFTHDQILDSLLETFDKSAVELFRAFMARNKHISKWFISADFCLHDDTRPNDCMCFSVTPYDMEFDDLKSAVQKVMGRDLKKTRTVSEDAAEFLRDPRFFHIAILLPKERTFFADGPHSDPLATARRSVAITLTDVQKQAPGSDSHRRVRKLAASTQANNFNHELFSDVCLLALFLSFVSMIIGRESANEPKMIGWFSDRDSMTEWCDSILWDFALANVQSLAAKRQIKITGTEFPIAIPDPSTGDMWFDHLVRIADYIAGTLAVWDIKNNQVPTTPKSDKFLRMIEGVIADSQNLIVLGLEVGNHGLQCKRINVVKSVQPTENAAESN